MRRNWRKMACGRFWGRFERGREGITTEVAEWPQSSWRREPRSTGRNGRATQTNSVGGTGYTGEGFGVVEIQHAAFFVGGELADFGAMGPDDSPGANVERRGLQL